MFDEHDLLSEAARDVADHPREPVEDALDGQHPQARHLVLELTGDPGELLGALLGIPREWIVAEAHHQLVGVALEAGLLDDELADEVHQVIEPGDVDPDRLLGELQPLPRDGPIVSAEAAGFGTQVDLAPLDRRRSTGGREQLDPDDLLDGAQAGDELLELLRTASNEQGQVDALEAASISFATRSAGDRWHPPDEELEEPDAEPLGLVSTAVERRSRPIAGRARPAVGPRPDGRRMASQRRRLSAAPV